MEFVKKFYDKYDGQAYKVDDEICTECGCEKVSVIEFIAEHNAGEMFTVDVCKSCLEKYAELLG